MLGLIENGKEKMVPGKDIKEGAYDFKIFHQKCDECRNEISQFKNLGGGCVLLEYMSPQLKQSETESAEKRVAMLACGHSNRSPAVLLQKIMNFLSMHLNHSHKNLASSPAFSAKLMSIYNKQPYMVSKDFSTVCDCYYDSKGQTGFQTSSVWTWDYSKTPDILDACKPI